MTIVTTVYCDAFGCSNETEVESAYESDVSAEGFHEDPEQGGLHYCEKCWPAVEAEYEAELERREQQ